MFSDGLENIVTKEEGKKIKLYDDRKMKIKKIELMTKYLLHKN